MSVKGAAVLFIEQVLFIPNSKISSEKQLVGQRQDYSPFTVHAQNQLTHKHTQTHTYTGGGAASTIVFFRCMQEEQKETFTVYPAVP